MSRVPGTGQLSEVATIFFRIVGSLRSLHARVHAGARNNSRAREIRPRTCILDRECVPGMQGFMGIDSTRNRESLLARGQHVGAMVWGSDRDDSVHNMRGRPSHDAQKHSTD